MTQALFRIGGVYRTNGGAVVELFNAGHGWGFIDVPVFNGINLHGRAGSNNGQWLKDGRYFNGPGGQEAMSLIPGELHNFNGQWLPVEEKAEQPRAPYFAEALRSHTLKPVLAPIPEDMVAPDDGWLDDWMSDSANAAMIARDGPAKPVALPATTVAQEATSHAPLAGLTVLMERDHRFGLFRF